MGRTATATSQWQFKCSRDRSSEEKATIAYFDIYSTKSTGTVATHGPFSNTIATWSHDRIAAWNHQLHFGAQCASGYTIFWAKIHE